MSLTVAYGALFTGVVVWLLLVSRFTEGMRRGLSTVDAAAEATATAGASVLVAGSTVLVSLFGLALAGLAVYASFGYATFAVVGLVMASAVTLVPALCGLFGRRLLRRRDRRASAAATVVIKPNRTERWARWVAARPVPVAVENFQMLKNRQEADSLDTQLIGGGNKLGRVNLLNWDGRGMPEGLFPDKDQAPPSSSEGSRR